ncbi:hypothetical protein [Cylindrospermopsis raciborskii]|uniref:hypothetical protein n=1 Tax=Cylindrospermopsis raciborskii TaxID=77022 RepID=UPI00115FF48F|nr:hypothetical protein [Cylindrospermopsis raciborskii]
MAHLRNLGIDPEDSVHKPHSSATLGDRSTMCMITRAIALSPPAQPKYLSQSAQQNTLQYHRTPS